MSDLTRDLLAAAGASPFPDWMVEMVRGEGAMASRVASTWPRAALAPEAPRSEQRLSVQLTVHLVRGRTRSLATTGDVSYRGLFVRTEEVLEMRQLLRIEVPDGAIPIRLHGMVTHRVPSIPEAPGGVGVRLYGVGGPDQERWEQLVREHRHGGVVLPPGEAVDEGRDAADAALEVRCGDRREIARAVTQLLALGGLVVCTEERYAPGTRFLVELVLPGERIRLEGVCRSASAAGRQFALGVVVERLDEPTLARLRGLLAG